MDDDFKATVKISVGAIIAAVILFVIIPMAVMPKYRIYKQDLRGQATLREAEWTKKVVIEEARAKMESASLEAKAEVARAKGVAEANKIIGNSLKDNEGYLRYLWINNIGNDSDGERIYIPTEAGMPILEARSN